MGSILDPKLWNRCLTIKKLDINYLKSITKDFSDDQILGRGGYGIVYKGEPESGEVVAVKKLNMSLTGTDEKLFMNEVQHVKDISHPNIVRLEGYCYNREAELIAFQDGRNVWVDKVYRVLSFEYLPKGSLDKYLSDESSGLDWHARYNIIEGICAGLYCLHEGREGAPILHLDLKPSNILLDKNMTPKIADFGLSRLFPGGKTHTCATEVIGTRPYMAPEYIDSRILSKESDIFSLGVIIFEIVTGHNKYPEGTSNEEFTEVYEKWRKRLQRTSKQTLWQEEWQQVDQCIALGQKCMEKDRKKRPNIREIIEILKRFKCSAGEDGLVIGIDLGTTNSCVGVWMNGRVEIVPSDQGTRTTPSRVAFTDSERIIGERANYQVATNASNTVFGVKRVMGRSFSDVSVQSDAKYWPFGVIKGRDDKPLIRVSYLGEEKGFSPEEISAMVLVMMKETAEAYAGETITDAVITVPAYFNGSQRQATKDAGVIAGLNVLHIINEPTAAAVAYSINTKWRESTVLVYDLGGGALDVSLVVIKNGALQVIATAGDTHLGGEDFTNNMVEHFVKEFKKKNSGTIGDISSHKKAIGRLRRSCEEEKKRLSTNPHITVEIDALFEGIDFYTTLSRNKFEQLNKDLFDRCMEPIAKCLADAKMDKSKVDDVVLVGCCTRIPRVHQLVQGFFGGKELCRNIHPNEAVAYGATVQARMLMVQNPPQVFDITPFSVSFGIREGLMREVIGRHTPIPTTETTFVPDEDNQSSVVTVYEDERAMAKKLHIVLDPKNKVRFHIDQDGILHVSFWAQDKESWITITNRLGRFSTEEIERMKQDAQKYKTQDEEHRKNVQARNDIENLLYTISNTMRNLDVSASWWKHRKATIKKIPDRINKLHERADMTTEWLENKELTTREIMDQKKQLEDEYHSISKTF